MKQKIKHFIRISGRLLKRNRLAKALCKGSLSLCPPLARKLQDIVNDQGDPQLNIRSKLSPHEARICNFLENGN